MKPIDVAKYRREWQRKIEVLSKSKLSSTAAILVEDLIAHTPVDTGKARASWSIQPKTDSTFSIVNDVPYIGFLNEGSSTQAPAHFIERISMKYGKPIGTIVRDKP